MTVLQQFEQWLLTYWPGWAAYLVPPLVAILVIIVFMLVMVMLYIYLERRGIGRFQVRPGPNRAGPAGILQPVADAIKVLLKEDIVPFKADKWVHWLAPIVVFVPALAILAVIPFGAGTIFADLNIGILYVVAISSLTVVGLFMAGWGSNNKYTSIAAMRVVAQMVSYEIPLVISIVGVLIVAGSLSMVSIVQAQQVPFFLLQPLGFVIFFLSATAEINRSPFDLLEAESEIITGYHIEYSGMKFALFYLGEYGHALAASAIIATLFLGGWTGPLLPPFLWFLVKIIAVFVSLLWLRATLPRLRVDQLMGFAWKGLFPLSILNLFIIGIEKAIWPAFPWQLMFANIAIAALLIVLWSSLFRVPGEGASFRHYGRGMAKGMALTFRHLFRRPITVAYPEVKLTPSKRIRGNRLVFDLERCNGCRACVRACPISIIEMQTSKGEKGLNVDSLEVDFGRCMFCGLCVEACNLDALFLSRDYELASYRRGDLVVDKAQFVAEEKRPSAYAHEDMEEELPAQTMLIFRGEKK